MAYDFVLLGAISASILFLALLVWKMYEHARSAEWSEVSTQAREARKQTEQMHEKQ